MRRLLKQLGVGALASLLAVFVLGPTTVHAAFSAHNLLADSVTDNYNSLTAGQIDAWLNDNFPDSCISTDNGFSSVLPTGYSPSTGYTYGSNVSAGRVIYTAAQAYEINPQVLLTTLQKEQSLVSGDAGCSTLRYTGAMGYGCPDGGHTYNYSGLKLYTINGTTVTSVSGTCVNSAKKAGFSQQVVLAAWLLKFGEQRSKGNTSWAIVKGNWNNSDDPQTCYGGPMTQGYRKRCSSDSQAVYYDGYTTIDGQSTHMDTGSTAALYWYTPHFAGNQHFVSLFEGWFGSTKGYPYAASITAKNVYSDSGRTQLITSDVSVVSGQTIYLTITATNTGNQTWHQSYTKVAVSNPYNRTSVFRDNSWVEPTRPARLVESSVAPGQTGTFRFSMTAPTIDKTYTEWFAFVAEGQNQGWMRNGTFSQVITVSNPYNATITEAKIYRDSARTQLLDRLLLLEGQTVYVRVKALNTGTQTWSNSFAKVAVTNPTNRTSLFRDSSWPENNRPARLIEGSVPHGQTGTFEFSLTAPATDATYDEWFGLVAEGQNRGWMPASNFVKHIVTSTTALDSMIAGQRMYSGDRLVSSNGRYRLIMQGDGNLVLYSLQHALWSTRTNHKGGRFVVMQGDGNLVLYNSSGRSVWNSNTDGHPGARLLMQNDGNLVIYNSSGKAIWSTGTDGKI
jgi:hypothetical protein